MAIEPAYAPPSDVHPALRRDSAPRAALELLVQAHAGLEEAARMETANERYALAHRAALRTAAAVLAVRNRPEPPPRRRQGSSPRRGRRGAIRPAWEVLAEVAPELAEWSALFAAGARQRARAEAAIKGAVEWQEADELLRAASMFTRIVERMLLVQPGQPGQPGQPSRPAEPLLPRRPGPEPA